jgi:hypothetical protein
MIDNTTPGLGWSIASLFEVGELVSWANWSTNSNGEYKKNYYNGIITEIFSIPEGSRKVFIAEVIPFGSNIPIKIGVFRLRKLKDETN